MVSLLVLKHTFKFQHTAARRRLAAFIDTLSFTFKVSTHSRPKAAGPPELPPPPPVPVSTHSRPKAAGLSFISILPSSFMFQHTAARRRLDFFILS